MLTFTSYDGIVPAAAGTKVLLAFSRQHGPRVIPTERDLNCRLGGLLRILIKMQISGSMTLSPAYLGMADFTGALALVMFRTANF